MPGYDRLLVERLLPTVWDTESAYGMEAPSAPDQDMPKGTTDPKYSGTLNAHLADIKAGWAKASLTHKERRALFLSYALDWSGQAIAKHEGVSKSTISDRLFSGVGKVVSQLNGDVFSETLDDAA